VYKCPPPFLGAFYLAPSFAMTESDAPLRSRALHRPSSVSLLIWWVLGFGPQLIGIASDVMRQC